MATQTLGKNISSLPTSTIQKVVGTKVDNNYGVDTTAKVKAFQQANGLVADGIVGSKTQAVITANMNKPSNTTNINTPTDNNPAPNYTYDNGSVDNSANDAQNIVNQNLINYGSALTPDEQSNIQSEILANMQGEIDAQNALYASKLADEKILGQGRLGSNTSVQARRGLLGSDFGNAETDTVNVGNQAVISGINAEKASALQAIYSAARIAGEKAISDRSTARQGATSDWVDYVKGSSTRAKEGAITIANDMIAKGFNPSNIDKSYLETVANSLKSGTSASSIISEYNRIIKEQEDAQKEADLKTRKAEAEINKYTTDQANWNADYNLKIKELNQKASSDGLLSVTEANAAGVPYGTTKSQLMNKPITAVDSQKSLDQIALAKKSLKNAEDLAYASGRTDWGTGIARKVSGARPIDNLTAETNTLRTNILTMATDPSIKKFFGPQMSNADVQLMTAAGTTLNPELQSPTQMKEELLRLKNFIDRAEKAVKDGTKQIVNTPAVSGQVMVSGVLYNVDASGEMTPAQ
jgi:peptidoglycan hydrolase-like protein with peptidoglycan-binding domain